MKFSSYPTIKTFWHFEFLSSSLDIFAKNFGKDGFRYLSQPLIDKVLDLVRQKGIYPYECISDFENFKKKL